MTPSRRAALASLRRDLEACGASASDRVERFVQCAWEHLRSTDVSWLGFYRYRPNEEDMVLEACRDRPACSPIGLHGVCGQAHRTGRSRIVRDVAELGDAYVACDPRDRSELVIPLRSPDRAPDEQLLVLDLDSFQPGAFDLEDEVLLREALEIAGFDPISGGPPNLERPSRS